MGLDNKAIRCHITEPFRGGVGLPIGGFGGSVTVCFSRLPQDWVHAGPPWGKGDTLNLRAPLVREESWGTSALYLSSCALCISSLLGNFPYKIA